MSSTAGGAAPLQDEVAEALARFVCEAGRGHAADVVAAVKLVLLDSFAVALGALTHPAAEAAQRYAALLPLPGGCRIWGTRLRASPETASLVNGVPLRAYDFNDLYMARSGGHPSDIVPGVIAAAEWKGARGRDVVHALAVGYEVALHLLDTIDLDTRGWDYVNVTAIAATCAVGTLLGLDRRQLVEALGITVVPHLASLEIESGELNRRGDLTMWKRFNGSDAVRHAVYACTLATVGVEGAVRPFTGRWGVLALVDPRPEARSGLLDRLGRTDPPRRIREVTFKRWPVGSRAQGAIQAALEARRGIGDLATIREIRVHTQSGVHHHLVASRQDPWHPFSRETADHSLPYIVAAAVLEGGIRPESFEPARVREETRQRFLQRVKVAIDPELDRAPAGQLLSRVEIETADGQVHTGRALPPPGHPAQPLTEAQAIEKLRENADPRFGPAALDRLIAGIRGLDGAESIGAVAACLEADR